MHMPQMTQRRSERFTPHGRLLKLSLRLTGLSEQDRLNLHSPVPQLPRNPHGRYDAMHDVHQRR